MDGIIRTCRPSRPFDEFRRAVDEFVIEDLALRIDADAMTAARASLDTTGLLLLGEVHGVRQNPLIIRALMLALGLSAVALGRARAGRRALRRRWTAL